MGFERQDEGSHGWEETSWDAICEDECEMPMMAKNEEKKWLRFWKSKDCLGPCCYVDVVSQLLLWNLDILIEEVEASKLTQMKQSRSKTTA